MGGPLTSLDRAVLYRRAIVVVIALAIIVPPIMKSRGSSVNTATTAFPFYCDRGFVRISGDVTHPGVYPMTANEMTVDAIRLAVPRKCLKTCSPSGITTIPVKNGIEIRLKFLPDGAAFISLDSMPTAQRLLLGIPLDINMMTADDFDRLPGIGPATAERIVEYRQINGGFMAVHELRDIEGIGEKRYMDMKKYF